MSESVAGTDDPTSADPADVAPLSTVPLSAVPATGGPGEDPVDVLREQVGRLVVAHPGVLRLEPTLLGALQGLRQHSSLDGIQLETRGRVVDLDLNVSTRATHQARASVLELHAQLVDLITAHGYVPGTLEISVLAIEEPAG